MVPRRSNQNGAFAHGLMWSGEMYAAQVAALSPSFRCVTFDFRGQGRSEVTAGGYDMDTLASDAAALIESLDLGRVHFAGLSMGGIVAMRLAARRRDLLRSVMLLDTTADEESTANIARYKLLGCVARWFGFSIVTGQVMPIMFGKTFMTDPARANEREYWRDRLACNDRAGIQRALAGVIQRAPIVSELGKVKLPALVIVGEEDAATPTAKAERIAGAIAGAQLVIIPKAGHLSTIEAPAAVNAAILRFLNHATGCV